MTSYPAGPWDRSGLGSVNRLPMHSLHEAAAIDLDGLWEFQLRDSDSEAESPDWAEVSVPSLWTMGSDRDGPHYTNVFMPFDETPPTIPAVNPMGVYRRTFVLPSTEDRVILHVGGAEGLLHVRVNGEPVGTSSDAHLHAEFDISRVVSFGENSIELSVTKYSTATYIEDQDQWWHGGLSRSVRLLLRPVVRIADVVAVADYDRIRQCGSLRLSVATEGLAHHSEHGYTVDVVALGAMSTVPVPPRAPTATLPPPARDRSRRPERKFADDFMDRVSLTAADAVLTDDLESEAPKTIAGVAAIDLNDLEVLPWTAESPHLEEITLELRNAHGVVVDQTSLRVGFRRVEIVGRDLLVNGSRIMIQGVNRHDFDPYTGRVMTRERMRAEVLLLKQYNVNAVRTSHYPNDPFFLDLCDEFGLYVFDEANVEAHAFMTTIPDDPTYLPEIVTRVSRMVVRDRNHPSIICWSLGNESGYGSAHDAAAAWVRHADTSRPVQYEGAVSPDWYGGHAASDIACPMYASFGSLDAYSKSPRADRPMILSEYAYSQGNSTGGLDHYWELFESLPGLQGGFIWEFADHALDPDRDGRYRYGGDFGDEPHSGPIILNGMVFADLTAKPALHEAKSVFAPARLVQSMSSPEVWPPRSFELRNRQTFSDLSHYRFELGIDLVSGDGPTSPIDIRATGAGETVPVDVPPHLRARLEDDDVLGLSLTVRLRDDSGWAPGGHVVGREQIVKPQHRVPMSVEAHAPTGIGNEGDLQHPLLATQPKLSLWRALTDNEMSHALDQRFVRTGLFKLDPLRSEVTHHPHGVEVSITYRAAFGDEISHKRRIVQVGDDDFVMHESVDLPENCRDLLRVGMEFELVEGCDRVAWTGLGPHENYPDRHAGSTFGRWEASIDSLAVPYVRPQENGSRGGVSQFEVGGEAGAVSISSDVPIHMNVGRFTDAQLEESAHWWEMPESRNTVVHVDVAQRGVGTGRIGPDTRMEFRLLGARYEWTWRLVLHAPATRWHSSTWIPRISDT